MGKTKIARSLWNKSVHRARALGRKYPGLALLAETVPASAAVAFGLREKGVRSGGRRTPAGPKGGRYRQWAKKRKKGRR